MSKDVLNAENIHKLLPDYLKSKIRTVIEDCVESTNKSVKLLAVNGEAEGYVLISRKQTKGRGRMGRDFYSPQGTGVYMSLLLRPQCPSEEVSLVTTAAAVSVCEALESIGASDCGIKWVNDIFVNGKKVCGILCEAGFNGANRTADYVVLGVGVNMYFPQDDFPQELQDIAGAVFSEQRDGAMDTFVSGFLTSFYNYYNSLSSREFISHYRKRCFVIGREISFLSQEQFSQGRAIDVDENCNLIVEKSTGERQVIGSGEISVRILGKLNQ